MVNQEFANTMSNTKENNHYQLHRSLHRDTLLKCLRSLVKLYRKL